MDARQEKLWLWKLKLANRNKGISPDKPDSKGDKPREKEEAVEAPEADTKESPETWASTGLGWYYPDK